MKFTHPCIICFSQENLFLKIVQRMFIENGSLGYFSEFLSIWGVLYTSNVRENIQNMEFIPQTTIIRG